jgi:predicted nucleic acid-binding protein
VNLPTTRLLIVDSSVAVKWFKRTGEPNLDEALELLRAHVAETRILAAPNSLRTEVLNALWSHRMNETGLRAAAQDLEGFRLQWFPVDGALSEAAAALAARYRLTVYDAVFAALAIQLDTELITADRALARSGACRARLLGE